MTTPSDDLETFRVSTGAYLAEAKASGVACPAFGAILPPQLHSKALEWQRHLSSTGYAGLHWPADHGGRGLSRQHSAIWYEECANATVAPYVNLQGIVLAGEAIMRSGTSLQRERFLGPTLSGEILWCQLFSEPGAGSDLAGLQSRAERDGDSYLLNGQKVWSSNAQFAQYGILMARTDQTAPKHRGISFFLLDMSLPGVEVRTIKQMTGEEEFCEVFFDDVAMPADALLGAEHGGWQVAMDVLGDERGSFGASSVISLGQKLDAIAKLSPGDDPHRTDQLAGLLARGNALKAFLTRVDDDPTMAPAGKLLRTEVDSDANALIAALRGAHAMLLDSDTEEFLYAPGMKIAGGSSEIQRNIIGERLLGLPREPVTPQS